MKNRLLLLAIVSLATLAAPLARADVKLPAIFSDHMVLQQDEDCSLWGWADSGEAVTVCRGGGGWHCCCGAELPTSTPGVSALVHRASTPG